MLVQTSAPPQLARWVDAFWLFEGQGGAHRVLPDGCIDFLVDLQSGAGSVAGPMTRAEVVELPPGARVFGVRFRPGAVALAQSHEGTQAALAALAGYTDESHLLREFHALAGLTPRALWSERRVGFVQAGGAALP